MTALGVIGFSSPWLLLGLLALPLLVLLLRAVPPAPLKRRFPGVALLLGLQDRDAQSDRTPWWLLLLRLLAVAGAIIGFAGPVLNPQTGLTGSDPLLIVVDGTWADATDWSARRAVISDKLAEAGRAGRPAALVNLTDLPPEGPNFQTADAVARGLAGFTPNPWEPDLDRATAWAATLSGAFETYWVSDGLDRPERQELLTALQARGPVQVYQPLRPLVALRPARFADGTVSLTAVRLGADTDSTVAAIGLDPAGTERQLATAPLAWTGTEGTASFDLPPELRNRITRFELVGQDSAGAVALTDDSLKRREVALVPFTTTSEGLRLLSPLHYLRQALVPTTDLIEGPLADVIPANPDVIALADVAQLPAADAQALLAWVEQGGLLLRFAGPRLAAADMAATTTDPLLPVRLRSGGRSVGGTMSWGEPKSIAPFDADSPFFGLTIPGDVVVNSQVVAQPGPDLADRVIAQLTDGTPLITRSTYGAGQIVLFHITANAEWSSLPLSGLFVQMLDRLAVSTRSDLPDIGSLTGTVWKPQTLMDGFGTLQDAADRPGVAGERLAMGQVGADLPPGLYAEGDRVVAVNAITPDRTLTVATWPATVTVDTGEAPRQVDLMGPLLAVALALLIVDVVATLALSGRLIGAALVLLSFGALSHPDSSHAQSVDEFALMATSEVVLAHVLTGNAQVDDMAQAGLFGLSDTLLRRTSVEPGTPLGVDIERDELAFFPLLYWPITVDQPLPSQAAYDKLNRYMATGGMILFDTRDGDRDVLGSQTPEGQKLRAIAAGLSIPPLERIPADHVLTRTFYLLQDFPGRYNAPALWVEAADPNAELIEGMPFRNLNDGVTPVVIGGNDWAAAWAISPQGMYLFPVGRGAAGERQREIAYRFGVNLVMHVLTGNYKSDQVHVPALLDRLGQ